jgi:copper chaperone
MTDLIAIFKPNSSKEIVMQTEILKVTGMSCGGCASNVTRALVAVDGVHEVQVALSANEVTVHFDEKFTSLDQLKQAVVEAGYGIGADNIR